MSINYSKTTSGRVEVAVGGGSVVSFQPQADTLTYEPYFGLSEKPFSLNTDPRFVYDSPTYVAARESLLAGMRRREGLLVLTGEIGTGKSTLCRAVLRDLGRKTYSSLVPDPFASREDLLKMLLIDFGVLTIQELTAGPLRGASRTELGYLLSEFLESLTPDVFVVVMIDEAQNLSLPLIEETRILADTFGARGRMQIVFVGQPELHAKLKLPEMRQVDQRVCGYHRLAPMSRDAVAGYIQHRLQAAGGHRERLLFPPAIIDVLHQRSGGVPRLINRVCDRALQTAFERKAGAVDREILDAALIEVGAVTLSPTWDSIIFAEPSASTSGHQVGREASASARENSGELRREPAVAAFGREGEPEAPKAPEARKASASARQGAGELRRDPAVAASGREGGPQAPQAAAREGGPEPAADEQEDFRREFADWLEQDLAPPSRSLTPLHMLFPDDAPKPERRAAPPAPRKTVAPSRSVKNDWPKDLHSETYIHRLWRTWAKRVGIALGVFVALNVAIMGGSFFASALTSPVLPASPNAPAVVVAGLALPEMSLADGSGSATTASAVPAAFAGSDEFLIAVGLFSSRERADQVVDALTQSGLPAMQRPVQLRRQQVQQIVLGPFFSRSDAARDLRRLQELGGYEDAKLVAGSQ